jgi:sec-independent protein translocase protein TatB
MFGIGLPDLLFILLLLLVLVKPSEWPTVARRTARSLTALRRAFTPVLEEMRGVRDSLMSDAASLSHPVPENWAPRPQCFQKGGEPDRDSHPLSV